MKKAVLIMTLALLYTFGIQAQSNKPTYFGDTFWKVNFDGGDPDLATWTQSTTKGGPSGEPGGATSDHWKTVKGVGTSYAPYNWQMANMDFARFIDPTSVTSLCAPLTTDSMIFDSKITSPAINATGKSSICVGFSIFKPYLGEDFITPTGSDYVELLFQVSKDNGTTWKTAWRSDKKATEVGTTTENYHGDVLFKGWYSIFVFLPTDYDNQQIKVRFSLESDGMRTTALNNQRVFIDNMFASTPSPTPNTTLQAVGEWTPQKTIVGAFFDVPLTLKAYNASSTPVTSIQAGFRKNKGPVVTETIDLSSNPIGFNSSKTFTLTNKYPSMLSTLDTLTVFLNVTGDVKNDDDSLVYYIQNDMTTVPYAPDLSARTPPGNTFENTKWPKINKSTSTTQWTTDDRNYNNGGKVFFVLDYSKQAVDADAYLFSRPVFVEKGKMYDINFDLYTYTTIPGDTATNPIEIYFTKTNNPTDTLGSVKYVNNVGSSNYKKMTLKYIANADTSFYVVFHGTSKAGSKPLILADFNIKEALAKDAALRTVNSPLTDQLEYSNSETVHITVHNAGSETIPAGNLKLFYKLDAPGDTVVYGTHTSNLAPNYAFNASFRAPAAVKDAALAHQDTATLKVWIESVGDMDPSNDTIIVKLIPRLAKIPYVADLGKKGARTYQEGYWDMPFTGTNLAWKVAESDTSAWFYAGAISKIVTDSDIKMYSRPFNMRAGHILKLQYEVAVSKANIKMPLKVGLYKKGNGAYTFVKNIAASTDTAVIHSTANTYEQKEYRFSASEESTYCIGFSMEGKDSINVANLMVKNFSLAGTSNLELKLLTPRSYRSLVKSTPVGVMLTNTGTTPIYASIPVSYQIDNQEVVTEDIAVEFETKEDSGDASAKYMRVYYFDKQPDMSAVKDYQFKVYSSLAGDDDHSNDTVKVSLYKNEPIDKYGDKVNPVKVSTGELSNAGSSGSGVLSNDGRLFSSFWQFDKPFFNDVWRPRYSKYTQSLDQEGMPQFRGQGVLVTDKNLTTFSTKESMAIDKENNVFMTYQNMEQSSVTGTSFQMILKKMSLSGENLFGEDGVALTSMSTAGVACTAMKVNGNGDVFAQINGSLKKISGADGSVMKSTSISPLDFVIDEKDQLHVLQMKGGGDNTLQYLVYNSNLEVVTPAKFVATQIAGLPIIRAKMTFDPNGGLWVTYASLNVNEYYYVQYLDNSLEAMIGETGVGVVPPGTTAPATSVEMAAIDNKLAVIMGKTGINDGKSYLNGQLVSKNGTLAYNAMEGMNIENPKAGASLFKVHNVYSDGEKLYMSYSFSKYGSADYRSKALKVLNKSLDAVGESTVYLDNKRTTYSQGPVLNDGYGFYDLWAGAEWDAVVGQHVYFDGTLAPKSLLIEVESADKTQGYVTGGGLLNQGDFATVKAVARTNSAGKNYMFDKWTVNGVEVSKENPYKFGVERATKLVANFKIDYTGFEPITSESATYAYPNPAVEYIQFANNFEGVVNFYNLSGLKVYTYTVAAGELIPVKNLTKGLYIIEMNNGNNVVRQQIIIK